VGETMISAGKKRKSHSFGDVKERSGEMFW
jgi:hypothetical protein